VGKTVLKNCRLWTGGADLTTRTNKLEISSEVEERDVTSFQPTGDVWTEVIGGLASTSVSAEGQWEAGDPTRVDDESWAALGGLSAWTAAPGASTVGAPAWLLNALRGSYSLGGTVGDVAPWSASASGTWPLVRGVIAHPPGMARTATGNGTAIQLGPVPAGRSLYATLHVLSIAGTGTPRITVAIESATANDFATKATRLTFAQAAAPGGQILRVAGPITDGWVRPTWTVTGTSPSFLFVVAVGVGA